jgi:NAD(P)-dependent dehydrogenase (short-subunit alcohol dehydrogenase family)
MGSHVGSQQGPRRGEATVARRLEDRVVVVTGGNGGIGLGMARGLVDAGATVAVWGRNPDKNAAAREELSARGAEVEAWGVDVAEEAEVATAMDATLERFGRVDAMIANAGVGGPAPFVDQTLEGWRRINSVNVEGAFLCFRAACRHMIDRGGDGALVGISSTSALQGAPANQAYSCSKAAVVAMVRGLAVEMARHEVRANAILPGWTLTDMTAPLTGWEKFMRNTTERTPVRRWGAPEDFAAAAVYFADPTLSFHTGDAVVIDGGYTIF